MGDSIRSELLAFAEEAKAKKAVDLCRNKEQQTKNSLVEPYIRLLGFDPSDALQVRVEYQTATVHTPDHVDYALMDVSKPFVFVEAKSLGHKEVANTPRMNKQLRSYMLDAASVKFGALTDGQYWLWYYKEESHGDPVIFLNVDALGDSQDESIVEWVSLLKQRAPVNDLLNTARLLSLASRIKEWFVDSLVNPSDTLARTMLRELGESNSSKSRIRQIKLSWKKAMQDLSNNPSAATVKSKTKIPSSKSDEQRAGRDYVLQYSNGQRERLRDATRLLIGVFHYCATQHGQGIEEFYNRANKPLRGTGRFAACITEKEFDSMEKATNNYSSMSVHGYHIFRNLDRHRKVVLIEALLKECKLPSGDTPQIGRDLNVHIPNTRLQISDLRTTS